MENNELLGVMSQCGHFLYHRRGGRRGQLRILALLREKGVITQKELLETLTLKSGSVSETVSKLEAKGFIKKEKDFKDKRRVNIILTDEGRNYLENQLKVMREQEKVMFTALNQQEQQQLQELLQKLLADWESKFDSSLFHRRKGE